jgi:flagellar basal-body rod protein FlgC
MELDRAIRIAAAGMNVQSARLRVVAENLANRDTTAETAGGDPFRRKTVTFANRFDRALGANTIRVARVGTAQGDFPTRYDPTHPAANSLGYVKTPNVNSTT